MKDEILLFVTKPICYDSNHFFVYAMAEALEELKVPVRIVDLAQKADREEALSSLIGQPFRAMIDFNSILPKLRMEEGGYFLDEIPAPFYDYIVDHPLYHHPVLKQEVKDFHVICLDQNHRNYIETYYKNIRSIHMLPLGGMQALKVPAFRDKKNRLILMATHTSSEEVLKRLEGCSESIQEEVKAVREILEEDRSRTQEEALLLLIQKSGAKITGKQFAEMMNFHFLLDMYLRAKEREEVVKTIVGAGYPLSVYGHGWEQFECSGKKHLKIGKPVDFSVSLEIMAASQICLNVNPRFHGGAHDRVFTAMANRAVSLTDTGEYLSEHFSQGKDICLYNMKEISGGEKTHLWENTAENIITLLEKLFSNPSYAQEIAEAGFEEVTQKHLWKHRMEKILEEL